MDKWVGRRANGRVDGRYLHLRCDYLHREERLKEELENWRSFFKFITKTHKIFICEKSGG